MAAKAFKTVLLIIVATALVAGCSGAAPSESGGSAGSGSAAGDAGTTGSSGTADGSGQKVELRMVMQNHDKAATEVFNQLFEEYRKENPNVNLEVEIAPGQDLATKIKVSVQSNDVPDVFQYWRPEPSPYGMDKFIEAGVIADISELRNDPQYQGNIFDERSWQTATVDGKLRGIPFTNFYVNLFVNKEIFDSIGLKLPETWDELLNATKVLKENGYVPWGISLNPAKTNAIERPAGYVLTRYLGNDRVVNLFAGKESWNKPDVIEGLKLLQQLTAGNAPEDATSLDDSAIFSKYISTGKAGMTLYGIGPFTKNINPDVIHKFVAIPFPLIPGGVQKEASVEKDLSNLLYISADAWADPARKDAAVKLVKKLTSKEAGKLYVEKGKLVVPIQGADIDYSIVPKNIVDSHRLTAESPAHHWAGKFMPAPGKEKFWPQLGLFWMGQLSPEELAKEGDKAFMQ